MRARSSLSRTLNALSVIAISLVVFVAWASWNSNRPPFDLERLNQLQPGMTKADVSRKLGKPTSDFGDHWAYSRFIGWPIVYVYFDDQGRLVRRVFDR